MPEGQHKEQQDQNQSEDKQVEHNNTSTPDLKENTDQHEAQNGIKPEPFPESKEMEKKIIQELDKAPMVVGEMWYLISKKWYRCWKEFVHYETSVFQKEVLRPGEIDNSSLVENQNGKMVLKPRLYAGHDYDTISPGVWKQLIAWYGGGPPIARPVIETGYSKRTKVETYPLTIKVVHNRNLSKTTTWEFTRALTLKEFKDKVCETLQVDPDKIKMFSYHVEIKGTEYKDESKSLDDERISEGSKILFEEEGVESTSEIKTTSISSYATTPTQNSYYYSSSWKSEPVKPKAKGLSGLRNLGNTCFMNSALQCLSNTVDLTKYFIDKTYEAHINTKNPLGMQGEIAKEYAEVIKTIWSGNESIVNPRDFKFTLGKFAPQFSGYQQQDSQEFLSFLLDGLHEDLNRVMHKPFVELKESDGRSDQIVAHEAWENHLKRNQSIIVDLFQGQYKSTLECPVCPKISITFDPFMYLTLPLPEAKSVSLKVSVLRARSDVPVRYALKIRKRATVRELKEEIAQNTSVSSAKELVIAEVSDNTFHTILEDKTPISSITQSFISIFAFEIPTNGLSEKSVLLKVLVQKPSSHSYVSPYYDKAPPFLLHVSQTPKIADLYTECWERVRHYLPDNEDEDEDEDEQIDLQAVSELIELELTEIHSTARSKLKDFEDSINLTPKSILYVRFTKEAGSKIDSLKFKKIIDDNSVKNISDDTNRATLKNCLESFIEKEQLSPDDPWYCPSCKEFREATKKLDLFTLPPILVIHLKRFQYTRYLREKLNTIVDFPITDLDLKEFLPETYTKSTIYDLFAISNHYGMLGGGHYTAFALNSETNEWYSFDDTVVKQVGKDSLVSAAAYLLFYKRRDETKDDAMTD